MKLYTVTYTYRLDGEQIGEMIDAVTAGGDYPSEVTVWDDFAHVTFLADEEDVHHER